MNVLCVQLPAVATLPAPASAVEAVLVAEQWHNEHVEIVFTNVDSLE